MKLLNILLDAPMPPLGTDCSSTCDIPTTTIMETLPMTGTEDILYLIAAIGVSLVGTGAMILRQERKNK